MSKADQYLEEVTDPLIELLAIKLFEHDTSNGRRPKTPNMGWMSMYNEDRESYRKMARGQDVIGYVPEDEPIDD